MASAARILANRRNARKSTGPRTPGGKNTVRLNALKHGLRAETIVLTDESPEEYDAYRETMFEEYEPVGERERQCVDRISRHSWRMQRCARTEPAMFERRLIDIFELDNGGPDKITKELASADDLDMNTGIATCYHHFGKDIDLHRRYEMSVERQYYHAIKELNDLQRRRLTKRIPRVASESPAESSATRATSASAESAVSDSISAAAPVPASVENALANSTASEVPAPACPVHPEKTPAARTLRAAQIAETKPENPIGFVRQSGSSASRSTVEPTTFGAR